MSSDLMHPAEEAVWESVRACIPAGVALDVRRTAKLILETFDHPGPAQAEIENQLVQAAIAACVPIFTGDVSPITIAS